ncbi:phage replisome organizer [Serratia sp. JSRIV001]|uniref:DnaT-like ssDNA-binding domain-containing protein n=1 Tax=unclassified Serratia (in: enterobacteria) TaxID=2647522 RepID=UPI001CBE5A06|nr:MULTISPECIES: DnaT-like ssDNA-binding domain-containing protein [unclassified Serratia (in: enterobacteria)]UAN48022.1 phage replisome organizer [Serratia sp. JSRIV001]UAN53803.1 phage replisome organizer [Serratia sp. JSRIV002]UAN65128.1 phage replisome organizer [Serratia sp. JSRIV006]
MANSWLRLWHDMPNDPKWRTIARLSGQPVALVQATYLHLLVSASQSVTRGHADVTHEDLASALDVTERDIGQILEAMQGRVLDGKDLTGWKKRQVKREDSGNPETGAKSAAERKNAQRERQRLAKEKEARHNASRNVTPDKDKDKDKDLKDKTPHNAHACEGEILPDDRPFPMFQNWRPAITQWPEVPPDIFAAALADFVVFWQAERSELQQSQWEQKFERSLAQFLQQNTIKQSRGSNANVQTTDPLQQVRAARNAERARCGLEPLGDNGEDLFPTVAPEERHHTLDGLGPNDFKALE